MPDPVSFPVSFPGSCFADAEEKKYKDHGLASISMIQKRIVNINEDTFEYSLSGKEGPNIVFISGFRIPMNSWAQLYTSAEELGRVFAYNRLGVGRSSKASAIQTGDVVVNSLRTLLKKLNVLPPYVLVAHSIGGLFANLFARMAPDEISSIVFVDAAHPDEKEKQGEFKPPILLHKVNEGVKSIERMFDKYKYSEDEHVTETVRQIRASGTFPPIPVAVVSGTKKCRLYRRKVFGYIFSVNRRYWRCHQIPGSMSRSAVVTFLRLLSQEWFWMQLRMLCQRI